MASSSGTIGGFSFLGIAEVCWKPCDLHTQMQIPPSQERRKLSQNPVAVFLCSDERSSQMKPFRLASHHCSKERVFMWFKSWVHCHFRELLRECPEFLEFLRECLFTPRPFFWLGWFPGFWFAKIPFMTSVVQWNLRPIMSDIKSTFRRFFNPS